MTVDMPPIVFPFVVTLDDAIMAGFAYSEHALSCAEQTSIAAPESVTRVYSAGNHIATYQRGFIA